MANTQISIDKNGTTTLATAGKYCDRNIDVIVEVSGEDAEPTQFTNLLKQRSTKIYLNQKISTTAGSMTTQNGAIVVEMDLTDYKTSNKPVWRFRGYTLAMLSMNYSIDGGSTWTSVNFYGTSSTPIDEYGDALYRFIYNTDAANLKVRFCLGVGGALGYSSAITSEDAVRNSGAIMTMNEPIGNGGVV